MLHAKPHPVEVMSPTEVARPVIESKPVVRAAGLGKDIDDKCILHDLNFEIRSGEYVTLLGANGAGKSTLLKVLATLIPASSGELELFQQPLRANSIGVRSKLGMIGHGAMLYRDLSARENLVFFGRLYDLSDPEKRADELLTMMNLLRRAQDAVKTFSRGMIQRVAIARALMHDPELLLADEPFAGLDAPSAHLLEETLASLHAQGKTIILANHDIRQSLELAQRAIVLRRGQLSLDRPASELDRKRVLEVVSA
jgi:heme exporter protein A